MLYFVKKVNDVVWSRPVRSDAFDSELEAESTQSVIVSVRPQEGGGYLIEVVYHPMTVASIPWDYEIIEATQF